MSNMSYCRFRNTLKDLLDCQEALDNMSRSKLRELMEEDPEEGRAAHQLVDLCLTVGEDNREMFDTA